MVHMLPAMSLCRYINMCRHLSVYTLPPIVCSLKRKLITVVNIKVPAYNGEVLTLWAALQLLWEVPGWGSGWCGCWPGKGHVQESGAGQPRRLQDGARR